MGNPIFYIESASNPTPKVFATGIDRLVSIKFTSDGKMYYLQRAGIGNGSVGDNTSTNDGSLSLVTYTGSGAPFISKNPESQTTSIGEDAHFTVYSSGVNPLNYQWTINGEDIGTDAPDLVISNVTITQDQSIIEVTISNSYGSVTSSQAILHVVNNTRPEPIITTPLESSLYKAGDILLLNGLATDQEDGNLDNTHLDWRIDFHHDSHTHPAMFSTSGNNIQYTIPTIGETAPQMYGTVYT